MTQKVKTDLLQKVVELEERRNQEDEFEWRKGIIKISFLRPFSQGVFPYGPLKWFFVDCNIYILLFLSKPVLGPFSFSNECKLTK